MNTDSSSSLTDGCRQLQIRDHLLDCCSLVGNSLLHTVAFSCRQREHTVKIIEIMIGLNLIALLDSSSSVFSARECNC